MERGEAVDKCKLVQGQNTAATGSETEKSYGMQIAFYFGDLKKATKLSEQLPDPIGSNSRLSLLNSAHSFSRLFMFALNSYRQLSIWQAAPPKASHIGSQIHFRTSRVGQERIGVFRTQIANFRGRTCLVGWLSGCSEEIHQSTKLGSPLLRELVTYKMLPPRRTFWPNSVNIDQNWMYLLHCILSSPTSCIWRGEPLPWRSLSRLATQSIFSSLDDSGAGTNFRSRSRFNECISETHKSKDRDHML